MVVCPIQQQGQVHSIAICRNQTHIEVRDYELVSNLLTTRVPEAHSFNLEIQT